MTSPCCGGRREKRRVLGPRDRAGRRPNLLTKMWSPTCSVGTIEPLGILKASTTNARRISATATAMPIDSAYSRISLLRQLDEVHVDLLLGLARAHDRILRRRTALSSSSRAGLSSAPRNSSRSLAVSARSTSRGRRSRMRSASSSSAAGVFEPAAHPGPGRSVATGDPAPVRPPGRACRWPQSTISSRVKAMMHTGTGCLAPNARRPPRIR